MLLLLFCLLPGANSLHAQRVDLSTDFSRLLAQTDAELLLPLDTDYRDVFVQDNRWLNYDFAIRSRREKMEIRYALIPYRPGDRSFFAPHVKAMRTAMQLATNDEHAVVTALSVPEDELQDNYGADWGKLFVFQPKPDFSRYTNCQMLALFREGKGMAYVIFLFDKAPFQLDSRHLALRFRSVPAAKSY